MVALAIHCHQDENMAIPHHKVKLFLQGASGEKGRTVTA